MKTVFLKKTLQSLVLLAVAGFSSASFAGATWVFGDNKPASECTADEAKAGCVATNAPAGTPVVKVSAFSTTGSGSAYAAATLTSWSGGLGVLASGESNTAPQHAVDSSGSTDLVLLDFGTAKVDLDSLTIGWKGNSAGTENGTGADADISVFRYTGPGAPTVLGLTTTGMTGWTLVGNYADLVTGAEKTINSTNTASSWWLISAYNSNYGAASGVDQGVIGNAKKSATAGLQGGNDYFKVLSVVGTVKPTTGTPEPGSLALMGIAMAGVVAVRRRKQTVV
jgi:hypothetical protein